MRPWPWVPPFQQGSSFNHFDRNCLEFRIWGPRRNFSAIPQFPFCHFAKQLCVWQEKVISTSSFRPYTTTEHKEIIYCPKLSDISCNVWHHHLSGWNSVPAGRMESHSLNSISWSWRTCTVCHRTSCFSFGRLIFSHFSPTQSLTDLSANMRWKLYYSIALKTSATQASAARNMHLCNCARKCYQDIRLRACLLFGWVMSE